MAPSLSTAVRNLGRFLFAAGGGIVVGVGIVATVQTLAMSIPQPSHTKPSLPAGVEQTVPPPGDFPEEGTSRNTAVAVMGSATAGFPGECTPAWRYAEALMAGDGETAVSMLSWVQDRLKHVQRSRGAGEPVIQERERLVRQILDRSPEGAVVRDEGIEDQYVFVPGCRLERISHDAGATGLEAPAVGRDWIRVVYPNLETAPKSPTGKPYRTLVVGLNWDANGLILKGNVIGNLEIDLEASSR